MKREGQENNKNTSRSDGIYVPLDLTVEILSKLPVKSLARFQCVSKLWLSLISKSIMTWSLTKPRLLILFHQRSLNFLVFSLSGHLLNTYKEEKYVYMIRDCHESDPGVYYGKIWLDYDDEEYQYNRGLICRLLTWGEIAISNPTTQQTLVLPEIKPYIQSACMDTLFGYDPIENQYKVMCMIRLPEPQENMETLCKIFILGDPKKQWRNIQGFKQSLCLYPNMVCINGKIYFRACIGVENLFTPFGTVLLSFDVRSERFDHHGLFPNQHNLLSMILVNYQGKLGYISYNNNNLEMWIMDHTEKQEWSKYFVSSPPLLKNLGLKLTRIVGVTNDGEIVIMPKKFGNFHNAQMSYVDYYDPKQNKTRRVEFKSSEEIEDREVMFSIPDYVENTMSLYSFCT